MNLLVPLYVHPAEDPGAWHRLINAADRTYGVVLNPASGPGTEPDPAFAAAAEALRAAGTLLLGYVDTDYGTRPADRVLADVRLHRAWYGVDGCFLDQVTSTAEDLPACRRLVRGVRRAGAGTVVLNPGVQPAPGYTRLADLTVTFEGPWSTYVSAFTGPPRSSRPSRSQRPARSIRPVRPGKGAADRLCHLVYGVPEALVPLAVRTATERGASVCGPVTGEPPNPWAALSPALTGKER